MGRFDQKMREVERSLAKLAGNKAQAAKFRKGLEKKVQQAAVKAQPKIIQKLVKSRQTGWVNDPGPKGGAILVERDTGCVLLDFLGKEIRGPKVSLPSTPALNKSTFLQNLKAVEGFATHMYKDTANNVTVGIGLLLRSADEAKKLQFVIRGTNQPAIPKQIENAFNTVKNSNINPNLGASAFKPVTNIEILQVEAENKAKAAMGDFLRQLRASNFFPNFDTYPITVQMGLLYQVSLIKTHRDRAGDPPGRREAAGDVGHRQGFPTPAGGSPTRPERRLPKAFGRCRPRLAMPGIATPRAPGRKPWEAVSMSLYQRDLVV